MADVMLEQSLQQRQWTSIRRDDDLNDRLNRIYCPVLFCFMAVVVTAAHASGTPIICWIPPQFAGQFS